MLLNVKQAQPQTVVGNQVTVTASGTIHGKDASRVVLNNGSADIALVLANLIIGQDMDIFCQAVDTAHTVTLPSGMTFDGTNNTATLNAAEENITIAVISATRCYVKFNNGSVALSAV